MKCRIKSSGEIVDVINWSIDGAYTDYIDKDGIEVSSVLNYYKDFEHIVEDNIDWENRRYELVKSAMQGILSNGTYDSCGMVVSDSIAYSDMIIEKLKAKTK